MTIKTTPYDSAEHLRTPEAIAAYLNLAFEDGNVERIDQALAVVARARALHAPTSGAISKIEESDFQVFRRVLSNLGLRLQAAS